VSLDVSVLRRLSFLAVFLCVAGELRWETTSVVGCKIERVEGRRCIWGTSLAACLPRLSEAVLARKERVNSAGKHLWPQMVHAVERITHLPPIDESLRSLCLPLNNAMMAHFQVSFRSLEPCPLILNISIRSLSVRSCVSRGMVTSPFSFLPFA